MRTLRIERLIRPHLANSNIETYDPVEPPEILAAKAGVPKDRIIKLNGNENPYGGSAKVAQAIIRTPLHVYPDPLQRSVRSALSSYTGLDDEHIIAGAGSDELIDLLFRLFVSPGEIVIDCEPTFGMYSFCAAVAGAETITIQRDDAFEIDADAIAAAVRPATKIIFVSSPNNPTGNLASEVQIKALLETGVLVVVDEAYYEFGRNTVVDLVRTYENLVVLRTMSKWAGLAGLRVGYGIMSPTLVKHIIDIKSPYNVSTAAEAALIASIEDVRVLLEKVELIIEERDRMSTLLDGISGIRTWPSAGNFILCEFDSGIVNNIYEGLASRGIFVRKFANERLKNHLRISVGIPEQTDAVVRALGEMLQ